MKNDDRIPPLDPADWGAFRNLAHRVFDDTLEHLRTIRESKVWNTMPGSVREAISGEALPRSGIGEEAAYRDYVDLVRPYPSGNLHPRSWGWVRGNGTPFGALSDFLASSLNPNTGGFDQAPVLVERKVVAWFAELMGFPATTGGIMTSGGSMANVVGLNVARNMKAGFDIRAEGLQGARPRLLVYGGSETHGWLKKACEMLGLGASAFRRVPVDDQFRIRVDELERMIAEDRAAGHQPICVVGTAGTVNTGATDDLVALADVCARENLWYHVDGAFGALIVLSPKYSHMVRGMERADSIAFDLHKWGYLPFDIACTLVRRDEDLANTYSVRGAAYLETDNRGAMANLGVWFADRGIELSRDFKSLKAWMTMRAVGVDLWGAHIERNIGQMQLFAAKVEAHPELELLAPAPLNVVNFRWRRDGIPREQLDAINREILFRLQEDAIALPSQTTLPKGFAIRCANTNHRTRDEDFDALIEGVVRLGHAVHENLGDYPVTANGELNGPAAARASSRG
jgi:glutamate/tyrosine decarboxylase-like PLP-dependent enzyme